MRWGLCWESNKMGAMLGKYKDRGYVRKVIILGAFWKINEMGAMFGI